MTFVLPDSFIANLKKLDANYKEKTGIDLSTAKQPNFFYLTLGAKNVTVRRQEVAFINKWLNLLENDLSLENANKSEDGYDKYINAHRLMVVVASFIIREIGNECTVASTARSATRKLIKKALYENLELNSMDDNTKRDCFLSAQAYLAQQQMKVSNPIRKNFDPKEWVDFENFIEAEKAKLCCPKSSYPITSIIRPTCAKSFQLIGSSTGWVVGNVASTTTTMMPVQRKLTFLLGSCLYLIMGRKNARTGVLILTPTYASKLIESTSQYTLSWLAGTLMYLIGNLVGWTIGMSLDLTVQLLQGAFCTLANLNNDSTRLAPISGLLLTDGTKVINGVTVQPIQEDTVNDEMAKGTKVRYEIDEKNEHLILTMGNQVKKIVLKNITEQPFMEELKQLIAANQAVKTAPAVESNLRECVSDYTNVEGVEELFGCQGCCV